MNERESSEHGSSTSEVQAMVAACEILLPLTLDQRERALIWLGQKLELWRVRVDWERSPGPLTSGHLKASGTLAKDQWAQYGLPVYQERTIVVRTVSTGDVDLYLRMDSAPTLTSYDMRGYTGTGNEVLMYTPQKDGTLHIAVTGYSTSSTFTLEAVDA